MEEERPARGGPFAFTGSRRGLNGLLRHLRSERTFGWRRLKGLEQRSRVSASKFRPPRGWLRRPTHPSGVLAVVALAKGRVDWLLPPDASARPLRIRLEVPVPRIEVARHGGSRLAH